MAPRGANVPARGRSLRRGSRSGTSARPTTPRNSGRGCNESDDGEVYTLTGNYRVERGHRLAGELILIVEDDERSRRLVRDVLQHAGYHTLEAATAADGIAQARASAPALIIMDIQLPDGDGVAALGEIRSDPATAAIPVIAVTAFAMSAERERFLAAGFNSYLAKPIDLATLRAEVQRLVTGAANEK